MEATFWAILPPIVAIIISLITKEVNLSLIIGIVLGVGIYTKFDLFQMAENTFNIMGERVYGNIGVLFFIVLLGMIVHLMNKSGATHKYALWASKKLKTKRQSLIATALLGIIIFVDDYFNCLTVGTVMKPITDKNKVSREKLAYIIDSTAAPICIIAPISSWAAAVSSSLPPSSNINGFSLFMKTILNNFYSLFSIVLIFLSIIFAVDFGKMRKYESDAEKGIYKYPKSEKIENEESKGKVIDLILPVLALIILSIVSMLYTGGFFKGVSISEAFANCDAILGLAMGAFYTVFVVGILYLPRKIVTFKEFLDGLVEGFHNMVPAILILTFAWTLGGVCGADYLNAGGFIASVVAKYNISLVLMPAIFFVVSLLLAFSTGTSWGTFAILFPITVSVFSDTPSTLMIMTTAAVLGGSVCGDHISPISDTTILSSTGAGCEHINHVSTQLQYGLLVACVCFICYIVAAFTENNIIGLILGLLLLIGFILIQKKKQAKNND